MTQQLKNHCYRSLVYNYELVDVYVTGFAKSSGVTKVVYNTLNHHCCNLQTIWTFK